MPPALALGADRVAAVTAGKDAEATTAQSVDATHIGGEGVAGAVATALPCKGGKPPAQGSVGSAAIEQDEVALLELDAEDEWGGRGSPSAAVAAAGDGVGGAAALVTGKGEAAAADVGGDDSKSKKSQARWVRAGWSTVDVRAVQSRLSRIVDDTSARIRSNIVVQVSGLWC